MEPANHSPARPTPKTGLAAFAAAIACMVVWASVASAHVTISDREQAADAYTVLTFSVPHGCDGSPTTEVRIQMPEEIPDVTPSVNPGWDVAKVTEELDEPIEDAHGATITERVAEVVYTAHAPLPDDLRDSFELSLKTPDAAGETLYFPTVQICEEGETAWVEKPTDGVSEHDLDAPAPVIELVAAGDGHDSAAADAEEVSETGDAATASDADAAPAAATGGSSDSDGSSNGLAVGALIVAILGVLLGGAGVAMARRRTA